MARLPRVVPPGIPHHVIQRGNNRCAIFRDNQDFRYFLSCVWDACDRYGCDIHAYVLMTNHVHLLLTPHAPNSLAKMMQSVGNRYVQYFNRRFERTGTLWEGRYRAATVDSESYLLVCSRYIELNPVRAGLVARPGDYPWSSFEHHALGRCDPLIRDHPVILALGKTAKERCSAYLDLFEGCIDEAIVKSIRDATHNGWALGTRQFQRHVESLTRRRAARLPKGGNRISRPKSV
jgi:putative transposase